MKGLVKKILTGALAVVVLCSTLSVPEVYAISCNDSNCDGFDWDYEPHVYKWCAWENSEYLWVGHGNNGITIHDKKKGAKYYLTSSDKSVISVDGLAWRAKKAGKATLTLKQKLNGKVTTIDKQSFTIRSDEFWNTRSSVPTKQTDLVEYADCIGTIRPGESKAFYFENYKITNVTPTLVGDSKDYATIKKSSVTDRYAFILKAGSRSDGKTLTISLGDKEVKIFVIPTWCIAPGEKFPFKIAFTKEDYGKDISMDFMWAYVDHYAFGLADETHLSLGINKLVTPTAEIFGEAIVVYGYYLQVSNNAPEGCYEIWPTYRGIKTAKYVKGYRYVWVTKDAAKLNLFDPAPIYNIFVERKNE